MQCVIAVLAGWRASSVPEHGVDRCTESEQLSDYDTIKTGKIQGNSPCSPPTSYDTMGTENHTESFSFVSSCGCILSA